MRADELSTAAAEQRAAQGKVLDERLEVLEDKLLQAASLEKAERGADDARTKLRGELAKHLPQGVEAVDAGRELLDEFRRDLERRRSELDELDRRSEDMRAAVEQLDATVGRLLDGFAEAGLSDTLWLAASEYTITEVTGVVYPNRILRESGFLTFDEQDGREHLSPANSRAWACSQSARP